MQDPRAGDGQFIEYSDEDVYLGMEIKCGPVEFKAQAIFNSLDKLLF